MLDALTTQCANRAALFTVYLYLVDKALPPRNIPFHEVLDGLAAMAKNSLSDWSNRELYRLRMMQNALHRDTGLTDAHLLDLTLSNSGLTAGVFTMQDGDVYVCFRGTGGGEWIDSGEGLSGIPEENVYEYYDENGTVLSQEKRYPDYATDQQVEALNWFRRTAARNRWHHDTRLVLAGHSKGGNKAQFVAIHEPLVDVCYSFDGQGFSPEALVALKRQYGEEYTARRSRLYSLSADNDYVNVLGERLVPPENVYFFASYMGFHHLEAMLDVHGQFRPQAAPGKLSRYIDSVSRMLMGIRPSARQYATRGVMNVFQRYLGEGLPVNGDEVSVEETVAGLGVAIGPMLQALFEPPHG